MFGINFRSFVPALGLSLMVVGVTNVILGESFISSGPGLWIDAMLVGFCTWSFSKLFDRPRLGGVQKILSLYDEQCHPQAFVSAVQPYIQGLRFPYNEYGVWLLTPYSMALVDLGRHDEALRYADEMRKSVEFAPSQHERGSMLVNMEPLIERLFGSSIALPLLERAMECMVSDPVANDSGRRSYVKWESAMLQAQATGNYLRLVDFLRDVRVNSSRAMRLRVTCALRESVAHRALGDSSRERECLEFVVEHGGSMPSAAAARQRLSELASF